MLMCYHDLSPLDLNIFSQAFKTLYIISAGLITVPSDIPVNLIFIAQQSSKMHDHFSVD